MCVKSKMHVGCNTLLPARLLAQAWLLFTHAVRYVSYAAGAPAAAGQQQQLYKQQSRGTQQDVMLSCPARPAYCTNLHDVMPTNTKQQL